ncbi:MAG: hypothetical protein R3Y23_02305 [Bacillota bacterium]
MDNEFNNIVETSASNSNIESNELFVNNGTENASEFSNIAEFNSEEATVSTSTKTGSTMSITTLMSMVASVIATAVVVISVIATNASNYIANFNALEVYGNSFNYNVSIEFDYVATEGTSIDFNTVDTSLRLVVVNSTTSMVIDLQVDENNSATNPVIVETLADGEYHITYSFAGTVDSLNEGTIYQIEIISINGDESETLATEPIKTLDGAVSQINGISYQCNCQIDDTFEFTIDYIDENNFYSDFTYSILNLDGSETVFNAISFENPCEKQILENITALTGGTYILQINYISSAYSETGDKTGQEQAAQTIEIEVKV